MAYKAPILTKSANIKILVLVTIHMTNLYSVTVLNLFSMGSTSTTFSIPSATAGKMTEVLEKLKSYLSFVMILYSSYTLLKSGVCLRKKKEIYL